MVLAIIALNLWVFFKEFKLGGGPALDVFIATFGLIPIELSSGTSLAVGNGVPNVATIFTSMFLHGGVAHLIGNLWFLWLFGDNVEDVYGHFGFLVFYLFVGVCAALFHIGLEPASRIPTIGASGAISGVLGAYITLFPRIRIRTLIFIVIFVQVISVPAVVFLGLWFLLQLAEASNSGGSGGGIAFGAHVGGFVAGVVVTMLACKKSKTPPNKRYDARRVSRW